MKTISIKINGKNKIFESTGDFFLINIMEKYNEKNMAVALNNKIIKKEDWTKTRIHNSDQLEIVMPFPGG
tara:strand:- start:536 stop:745 length:210 start_codon:yes stop_codon:yes gene_type:complete